ncbi:unnamed protein product [Gordionus sp. m RMFG-2023]
MEELDLRERLHPGTNKRELEGRGIFREPCIGVAKVVYYSIDNILNPNFGKLNGRPPNVINNNIPAIKDNAGEDNGSSRLTPYSGDEKTKVLRALKNNSVSKNKDIFKAPYNMPPSPLKDSITFLESFFVKEHIFTSNLNNNIDNDVVGIDKNYAEYNDDKIIKNGKSEKQSYHTKQKSICDFPTPRSSSSQVEKDKEATNIDIFSSKVGSFHQQSKNRRIYNRYKKKNLAMDPVGNGTSTPSKSIILPPYPIPAWIYCTRYSDRPSSGFNYRQYFF